MGERRDGIAFVQIGDAWVPYHRITAVVGLGSGRSDVFVEGCLEPFRVMGWPDEILRRIASDVSSRLGPVGGPSDG